MEKRKTRFSGENKKLWKGCAVRAENTASIHFRPSAQQATWVIPLP